MSQPTMAKVLRDFIGRQHQHFCSNRECRQIYRWCACQTPETNGLCQECKGSTRPVWCSSNDAHECCLTNTEQVVNRNDLVLYKLAGPGPWFQCKKCARCHGWPSGSPNKEGTS